MTPTSPTHPAARRQPRLSRLLLCGALTAGAAAPARPAAGVPVASPDAAELPAPQNPPPGPTTGQGRSFREIQEDIEKAGAELSHTLNGLEDLFDPARREKIAPKALPVMKRMSDLFDEGVAAQPLAKGPLGKMKMEITAMRAMLGDADAAALLRKEAVGTDPDVAVSAHAWQEVVAFSQAGKGPEAQKKAVTDLNALAEGSPENEMVAQAAYLMSEQASTPALSDQAMKIVTDVLKGPLAERMGADMVAAHKLRSLEGKPLELKGGTVDGKPFTSADWKGKVVLVDFWATWCGPCLQELPHVKKLYDQYHAKGLEIVGVSCDTDGTDLKNFLAANPAMTWPQLFDPAAAATSAFHPLAKEYGVRGIPTMFLIDRKGVVRTVQGQQKAEELIPKLLEEK